MKKVLIISNDSGGGHKQTAKILTQKLIEQGWTPQTMSAYREICPDYAQLFGIHAEEIYNRLILTKEMTRVVYRLFFLYIYYGLIQPNKQKLVERFTQRWQEEQPDLIISVIPLLNQIIAESLAQYDKQVPFALIQTDLSEFHMRFWLMPTGTWFVSDEQTYTIVGTEEAYQQVLSLFIPDQERVFKLSGTIVDPRFLNKPNFDRPVERRKLGLDQQKPVGLFLYGGLAPNRLFETAKGLGRLGDKVQYIFICGRNEALKAQVNTLQTPYKKVVLGYTSEVPYYMHLADFLIGKPGPGAIMEGVAANLPLLIDASKRLLHEANNITWIEEQGFGFRFKNTKQLLTRIQDLTSPEVYQQLKENVSQFENKAIFEMPDIIETIMAHFHELNGQALSSRRI